MIDLPECCQSLGMRSRSWIFAAQPGTVPTARVDSATLSDKIGRPLDIV